MPSLPTLNSLGKLCGSGHSQQVDRRRIKRKNSVKRISVIEDGRVAEVLYLIPKQSVMQQLPFINPDDYYLSESLVPGMVRDGFRWAGPSSSHMTSRGFR